MGGACRVQMTSTFRKKHKKPRGSLGLDIPANIWGCSGDIHDLKAQTSSTQVGGQVEALEHKCCNPDCLVQTKFRAASPKRKKNEKI